MAPKKKGGGKGGGAGYIIDGVSTTEMSREQLETFAYRLREEVEREREERNFFQLERDKIRTFWEITRQQLEEAKAELRNKDHGVQEDEEKHQNEIKVLKQKVKHLLYEHQNDIAELKAENMVTLKMAQDETTEYENLLLRDKRQLNEKVREMKIAHNNEIQVLKMEHSKEITKIRHDFEIQSRQLEKKYEKRVSAIYSALSLKNHTELTETEERKNTQINELLKNHEEALSNIKNYYNDITLNNLALINSLKEEIKVQKENEEQVRKRSREITAENHKLIGPLKKAQTTVAELQTKLKHYEMQKTHLSAVKQRLDANTKELKELKWTKDVLLVQLAKIQNERDELRDRFSEIIMDLQQKTGMRNLILHSKVKALTQVLEQRGSQLNYILQTTVEPARVNEMKKKLEVDKDLLDRKNAAIHDLQFEVARLCKAHDDLLAKYKSKLQKIGLPKEELGFEPFKGRVEKMEDGSGDLSSKDT